MAKTNSTATHAIEINAASLPSYIAERHQRAADAGLTIGKPRMHGGELRISYLGTAEQFVTADFVTDAARFLKAVAAPTKSIYPNSPLVKLFSPARLGCLGHLSRTAGLEIRLTNGGECLPIKEWEPCPGVKAYEFFIEHLRFGVCHAFVAKSMEALVNAGLAPQLLIDAMKTHRTARGESPNYYGMKDLNFQLWEVEDCEDFGLVKFFKYPENIEWAQRAFSEQDKPNHASPEEYRRARLDMLGSVEGALVDKSNTKDGRCISIGDEDVGEIQRLFSEIEGILTHCVIRNEKDPGATEHKAAEAKFAAAIAKRDPKFHSFLDQSLKMQASALIAHGAAESDGSFHDFMERTTKG